MRLALVPLLAAMSLTVWAADPPAADATKPALPWTDSFTMTLQDVERTYVVYDGTSYLMLQDDDFTKGNFLAGKDVMMPAKFESGSGDRLTLYGHTDLDVICESDLWNTRLDGDNLYLFGHCSVDPDTNRMQLKVSAMAAAPSDASVIADKLKDVPKGDWTKRLAVADQVRKDGANQGNREYWMQQADAIVIKTIDDAVAEAEAKKDINLARLAMDWSVSYLKDPVRAGRIGSAAWIRHLGGSDAEEVAKRMHVLGLELYKDEWRPRSEALTMEFEDRFAETNWRDADAFYRLGRWADVNADNLPQAKDRAYRAYQAGLRADPNHPGIRRELNLEVSTTVESDTGPQRKAYKDPATGIEVDGPLGWRRADQPIRGDVTFIDPNSDTAFISATFMRADDDYDTKWTANQGTMEKLEGYSKLEDKPIDYPAGKAQLLRFSYKQRTDVRYVNFILVQDATTHGMISLLADYAEEDGKETVRALSEVLDHTTFGPPITPNATQPMTPDPNAPVAPAPPPPDGSQPPSPSVTPLPPPPSAPAQPTQ